MMKKMKTIVLVTLFVSFIMVNPAFASHGDAVGSCPEDFELHHFMDHSGEHMHRHIGIVRDINGDGYICMQIVSSTLHLHVDNTLPLP